MAEVAEVKAATNPHEVLLVADALTGQDAVNTARAFDARVGLTGIVLTRMDGDGRGGAALSMRAVTGKPIKLVGTGEKVDALEDFHPSRVANRILGMGDIVGLVERAAENVDVEKAQAMAQRLAKGNFDLSDMKMQLQQMEKMGGLGSVMGMLPGMKQAQSQLANSGVNDKMIKRQIAIIDSMTAAERKNPDLLKNSRKKRIAAGSGTSAEAINKLLKMHRGMADMMKQMQKQKGGMLGKLGSMFGIGGGGGIPGLPAGFDPSKMDPAQLAELQKQMGGGGGMPSLPPGGFPGLPKGVTPPAGMMPKLPGLGGMPGRGLPGLGGTNPFAGKKK
jgi:signal recognition particle subunit SRP54